MRLINRASPAFPHVALETTLLVHGVPKSSAIGLHREISGLVHEAGAHPALVGVVRGAAVVGMTEAELAGMLESPSVPKANTSNLGVLLHWESSAATTVSATMELAAAAGIRLFATGGLGGVHENYGCSLDISSDLAAFTRFPVAVVASGVKSILDVAATREALETLGVPVVGYRTDRFPAFYQRRTDSRLDATFETPEALGRFLASELRRTGRGVVVANPIPESDEIPEALFNGWLEKAEDLAEASQVSGREVTPFLLARLHELSGGQTLRANIALVKSNARLAAQLASAIGR
ncbi:MAG: pseudouridine-5'-phosphate glycosidase [Phycisphaerales bacterium]|nr:pseudouridine-5'-phosphate glycosidase [Phycisphaerales bacterium]